MINGCFTQWISLTKYLFVFSFWCVFWCQVRFVQEIYLDVPCCDEETHCRFVRQYFLSATCARACMCACCKKKNLVSKVTRRLILLMFLTAGMLKTVTIKSPKRGTRDYTTPTNPQSDFDSKSAQTRVIRDTGQAGPRVLKCDGWKDGWHEHAAWLMSCPLQPLWRNITHIKGRVNGSTR